MVMSSKLLCVTTQQYFIIINYVCMFCICKICLTNVIFCLNLRRRSYTIMHVGHFAQECTIVENWAPGPPLEGVKKIIQTKMKTHTVVYPYIEESANTNYTQIF